MWLDPRICMVGRHERVYYLKIEGNGVLVDCGSEATYEENMRMLKSEGVDLDGITGILITHEHFDHVGAIARAKAELNCPVIAHRLAAPAIETGDPLVTAAEIQYHGVYVPFLSTHVDETVDEGDRILTGYDGIDIYHIPGHTPGGAAYLFDGNLLVGDTVFADGGIGWPDVHWGSCLSDHRESLVKILDIAPSNILPGHREPSRFEPSIIDLALDKIDHLKRIGIPAKNALPAQRRDPAERPRELKLSELAPMEGVGEKPFSLRISQLYEFSLDGLFGFVRPRGNYHGLTLFGFDGVPITMPGTSTMNLEHYCEEGRSAPFIPRNICHKIYHVDRDSLTIRFSGTSQWPVESRIIYRPRDVNIIDVTFEFTFGRSFTNFEAFIASYFYRKGTPHLHLDSGWIMPRIRKNQQVFFARDATGARQVLDGRWNWLDKTKLRVKVDPRRYEEAVLVDWNKETAWATLQMIDPKFCPSLSTNIFAHAQDLSLVGRDVEEGQTVMGRARVAYVKIKRLEEVQDLYQTFLEDIE